jgi:hypothetical protein
MFFLWFDHWLGISLFLWAIRLSVYCVQITHLGGIYFSLVSIRSPKYCNRLSERGKFKFQKTLLY